MTKGQLVMNTLTFIYNNNKVYLHSDGESSNVDVKQLILPIVHWNNKIYTK